MIDLAQNLVKVTVSGVYGAADFEVALAAGQGAKLSAGGGYNLVWWNITDYADPSDDPLAEITRVASVSGDVVTLVNDGASRTEQEGIPPTPKDIVGKIYVMVATLTAAVMAQIGAALRLPWQAPGAVTGTIDGANRTFALPWTPQDPNSLTVYLNQEPFLLGIHFEYNGDGTITYFTAPDGSFAGTGHYATGQ